jgi:hypothetical protein
MQPHNFKPNIFEQLQVPAAEIVPKLQQPMTFKTISEFFAIFHIGWY